MALGITKDKAQVGIGGGSILYLREVQSTGADLGTPDTNHSAGYVKETGISDVTAVVNDFDEAGTLVAALNDTRTINLKFLLMQRGVDFINMLKTEVRTKYYRVYYQTSQSANGKVIEYVFGLCKVVPKLELSYKQGEATRVPLEINVLKNESAITVLNADLPSEKVTGGVMSVAANAYYTVAETVVP